MLLDFPTERLNYLSRLKQQYNTALLSNTNTIHLDFFHQQLQETHQITSLDAYFKSTYFSCAMGMRKPNPEIFLEVCKREGFNPSETIFIDDRSEEHTSELQSRPHLVCRLLLEKKKKKKEKKIKNKNNKQNNQTKTYQLNKDHHSKK